MLYSKGLKILESPVRFWFSTYQLKILVPVGIAIIIVIAEKYALVSVSRPTVKFLFLVLFQYVILKYILLVLEPSDLVHGQRYLLQCPTEAGNGVPEA